MTNIVDATDRFGSNSKQSPKPTPLDELRRTKRVVLHDRPILAVRLGELAARIDPGHPETVAQRWFEHAWPAGDRWGKRKRLISFPGEDLRDPGDPGAYAAAGSDWAALIDQAAKALFPKEESTAERERARFNREMLRGTTFLPALNVAPLRDENARTLISTVATKIAEKLENETDVIRLWNVLATTPFSIESFDLERPEPDANPDTDIMTARFARRHGEDRYSNGPLGEVSKLAQDVSAIRYRQVDQWGYRFEPSTSHDQDWVYPILRLGLRGHSRQAKIFVIPQDFVQDLPFDQEFDDGEKALEERVMEWLIAKGLMSGKAYEDLPDISFDEAKGYGWRTFIYEIVQSIWIEVRPKSDGTPGLWVTASYDDDDMTHFYPRIPGLDTLAVEANSPVGWLGFIGMYIDSKSLYEFIEWPTTSPEFMVGGKMPRGAASGLIDSASEDLPTIEGWLDDLENAELQDMLFRNPNGIRFCPSIATDNSLPPPCQQGTVAAAIFTNAGCEREARLGRVLMQQARTIASAGLGFYDALIAHNRARIESMLDE